MAEAIAAGILDGGGEMLRFTHPLLASTLYEDSPPAERRDLHARLAGIVEDLEERARHLAEATDGPDEDVASALEAAGANVVARGAPDAAARLAKQAVFLTPPDRRRKVIDDAWPGRATPSRRVTRRTPKSCSNSSSS